MREPAARNLAVGHLEDDIFDRQAAYYDGWYDRPEGREAFLEELDALRPLLDGLPHPWLEVGVGSGRFAAALGVEVGVDPAPGALVLAARRGVDTVVARGERLPFPDATFGAALFVLTLCFVDDPLAALLESRRVVRPGGAIVLGLVPSEGPLGQQYQAQAAEGHPYYHRAHFFTRGELDALLRSAGLDSVRVRSALLSPARAEAAGSPAREGNDPSAGFTAILTKARPDPLARGS